MANPLLFFGRDEYQSDSGNLPHLHFLLAIDKSEMGPDAEQIIMGMIKASPFDIITADNIQEFIEEGLVQDMSAISETSENAALILPHFCNDRCQIRIDSGDGPENFKCRKPHNVRDTPDCSSHQFVEMPFTFKPEFDQLMARLGFCEIATNGKSTYNLPFFKPVRHMPPCMANDKHNISPVIPSWFLTTRSMVNAQYIGSRSTPCKYLLKYVAKFDQTQRIETSINTKSTNPKIGATFQHHTKSDSSRRNVEKNYSEKRNSKHPTGRLIAFIEMFQKSMLIPDVKTNLTFRPVSTQAFEIRSRHKIRLDERGTIIKKGDNAIGLTRTRQRKNHDDFMDQIEMDVIRQNGQLHQLQMITNSQKQIIFDDRLHSRSYDSISEFGVRPPELFPIFQTLIPFFRHTTYSKIPKGVDKGSLINSNLKICRWIDGFGRLIKLRTSTLDELELLLHQNLDDFLEMDDDDNQPEYEKRQFSIAMNKIVLKMIRTFKADDSTLTEASLKYKKDVLCDFFLSDEALSSLPPIPVISQINPINCHQWVIHLILSLGKYITEEDALDHPSFRQCLIMTKLISPETDEESCRNSLDNLLIKWINSECIYLSISVYKASSFIMRIHRILEDIIFDDSLPLLESPFTVSKLEESIMKEHADYWPSVKEKHWIWFIIT